MEIMLLEQTLIWFTMRATRPESEGRSACVENSSNQLKAYLRSVDWHYNKCVYLSINTGRQQKIADGGTLPESREVMYFRNLLNVKADLHAQTTQRNQEVDNVEGI